MSEELMIREASPTLAGIKTGSLFNCAFDSREEMLEDVRRLNRSLLEKGLCMLPLRFTAGGPHLKNVHMRRALFSHFAGERSLFIYDKDFM